MIRWSRVLVVMTKELRDTLRDRRTLLMMILVPALLYPFAGIVITQLAATTMARIDRQGYDVAVQGPAADLQSILAAERSLRSHPVPDARAALARPGSTMALGLIVKRAPVPAPLGVSANVDQLRIEVLYDGSSPRSRAALDRLRQVLDKEMKSREQARLKLLGLKEAHITPVLLREESVASESRTVLSHLAPAIGILLILLSLVGAFYPAIDLIAGERERGTLEPLLATPTSRLELLAGKYGCLVVLSLTACVLNLLALGLTTGFMLQKVVGPRLSLSLGLLALLLAATVPVLLLVSALLVLTAIFARSFKDAQNLMTPVYLLCLVPAMGAMVPEVHLTGSTAWVPILGSVLLIKEALAGTVLLAPACIAVIAGLCYSLLGIALAAYVFDRPDLIGTRSSDYGLSGFFTEQSSDGSRVPTLGGALLLFCVCLALMLHVGTRLQMANMRWGLVATEIGLILLPVVSLLRLARIPIAEGLGLSRIGARQVLGATLCGLGAVGVSLLLFNLVVEPLMRPPPEYYQALEALRPRGWGDVLPMLFIAALLPAVCEEALCRGLVLRAARRALGASMAIFLSGFLFAVLHIDPYRFLNTFLLGSLLSALAVLSGSTSTAVIMHLVNNATALVLSTVVHDPSWNPGSRWMIVTFVASALGLLSGMHLCRRRRMP